MTKPRDERPDDDRPAADAVPEISETDSLNVPVEGTAPSQETLEIYKAQELTIHDRLVSIISTHPDLSSAEKEAAYHDVTTLTQQAQWQDLRIQRLTDQLGRMGEQVKLLGEFSTEKAEEAYRAKFDKTTGLYLLNYFQGQLEEFLRREEKRTVRCAIGCLDLAYFKDYNDEHGHAAGNEVLAKVAREAISTIYETHPPYEAGEDKRRNIKKGIYDIGCRLGDEFYFLVASVASERDCRTFGRRITRKISEIEVTKVGEDGTERSVRAGIEGDLGIVFVEISPGALRGHSRAATVQLQQWADFMMYEVKHFTHEQQEKGLVVSSEERCRVGTLPLLTIFREPPFRPDKKGR